MIGDNHKGETLYKWDNPSGYVWKGFGDKDTHSVYKGDVVNGVPNGLGVLIYPGGGKYVGSWKNGKPNGQGTLTFPDGRKYVGEFKDGNSHGQGTVTSKDGEKFVGEWKDDEEWNGNGYNKDGKIISKYVNGKEIKQ